ncbi:hypothetical protein C2845_PM05G23010 [Panicum miliaceum]|uniref:Uncharacterized protein n=1 Tax=Panicum miliaceum TaxID=4540 RepID=A0A3L6T2E8_PANMI|nr:hypothetical protein C2845_PM05G23010 [Panicum miliaceum]
MSDEQREEINRKQREYKARKKAESSRNTSVPVASGGTSQLSYQSTSVTGVSTVVLTPSLEDKENLIPDDPMEWLHRNDNFVPRRISGDPAIASDHSICTTGPSTRAPLQNQAGSSSKDKRLKDRERYINMGDQNKKELLQRNGEYKKCAGLIMSDQEQTPVPTISPDTTVLTGLSMNHDIGQPDEEDFDPQLFQPTEFNGDEGDETCIDEVRQLENLDLFDDGIRQLNEGDNYESFRVIGEDDNSANVLDDAYDIIYHNLPARHKLRDVPDCRHCGA